MEEQRFFDEVRTRFGLDDLKPDQYSSLVLAYIGDEVYEMTVRILLLSKGNLHVHKLSQQASAMVRASAQAALIHSIVEELTGEEASVYRRGRNAKSQTVPKNASLSDYRHATGLEALCGYLYLKGSYDRLTELLSLGMERTGIWKKMPEDTVKSDQE